MKKTVKCIDLSKWNGDVDFKKVKADGISNVILRSSFRHTTDTKFVEYVSKAMEAGITILGVYHFSYALNTAQASSEAKYCLDLLDQVGLDDVFVFFDFEYDTITKAAQSGVTLLPVDANAHAKAFCEYIEKRGKKVGLYMNIDFYQNYYDRDLKGRYPIWLADYSGDPDYPCLIHQYTNKGRVSGITGNVDMDNWFVDDDSLEKETEEWILGNGVVALARSWVGLNEKDGSYKKIIDIYNSHSPLPRGVKMQYDWAWCACTWSAIAISLNYTNIMPIEISCGLLIDEAKKMGIWVENDSEVPKPGWGILYDWHDNGEGDNVGWPDHIGIVSYVNESSGKMLVVEGNNNNAVTERSFAIDSRYIRGYIAPKYRKDVNVVNDVDHDRAKADYEVAHEVIAGAYGNGEERKSKLSAAGYDPEEIQKLVNLLLNTREPNENDTPSSTQAPFDLVMKASCQAKNFSKDLSGVYVTNANLNLRNGAGTNHSGLVCLPKGSTVRCYGYYSLNSKIKWLYVETVYKKVKYLGFCCSTYLKKK